MPQALITSFYQNDNISEEKTGLITREKQISNYNFVYNPAIYNATFNTNNYQNATFIRKVDNIRLWVNNSSNETFTNNNQKELTENYKRNIVPFLKSHLQKAIRRGNTNSALSTTILLLQIDKTSLFRRLPIIAVEDVKPIPGTSIIVWLMMAGDNYNLKKNDIQLVLSYVKNLCETNDYLKRKGNEMSIDLKEINALESTEQDEMLALYYRLKWGGTIGDMKMISNAISNCYSCGIGYEPKLIPFEEPIPEPLKISLENKLFIKEGIDFHCFPWIIKRISSDILINEERVKEIIWRCESSLNIRKKYSQEFSEKLKETRDYKLISNKLDLLRKLIITKILLNEE